MRELKHHEQKLLKKVNFLEWKHTHTAIEQQLTAKYLLKSREEYREYNRIVSMIHTLTESLARLEDTNPTKLFVAKKLTLLLYNIGVIGRRKLLDCSKVNNSNL